MKYLRQISLLAALIATLSTAAQAQEPTMPAEADQAMLRAAEGAYTLEDGRTLKVYVEAKRLGVGLDAGPVETWKVAGNELLVSADGTRRVRLYRTEDGRVERIAYEVDRPVR